MRQLLEQEILPRVVKPTRYTGNEWNMVKKNWEETTVRMAFAFPDVYEVAMSHLGLQILYGLVNDNPAWLMERVFAPWVDMEEELRRRKLPLFSLESFQPLAEFDVIGFTMQYEMSYTNILNMLDLGGIPLYSRDRNREHPLVVAGGPCAFNPEPLADFMDCFLLGDGEELLPEVLAAIQQLKKAPDHRPDREELLDRLARVAGVYIPSRYQVSYHEDGRVREVVPTMPGTPARVIRRVVANLDEAYFPSKPIVPFAEVVHDRIMLEVLRGCTRGCRFCQAGILYRPVRERSPRVLTRQAAVLARETGHHEISLTSLSTADYTGINSLVRTLLDTHEGRGVGISLPSLRVDAFSVDLAKEIQRVRRAGLTFAPEAGSQRLRDVINKGVTEEDLVTAVTGAFEAGWRGIKLYFMMGLPTETKEDLEGIARLARRVLSIGQEVRRVKGGKAPTVTVSISSFVPKAHTPFQWEPQDPVPELQQKQQFLKGLLRGKGITYNYHDARLSFLEAVFARGDRRLAPVLASAWARGCKFDSWSEHFRYDAWMEAFQQHRMDPVFYANRTRERTEVLPWDHLDPGVSKDFLWEERQMALAARPSADCRQGDCPGCGVCPGLGVAVDLRGGDNHAQI